MPSVNFFVDNFHGNLVDANHGIGCSMVDHFLISSHHQKFGQLLRKLGVTRASMAFEIKSWASWRRSWVDLGMSRLSSDNDIFKFIVCYPRWSNVILIYPDCFPFSYLVDCCFQLISGRGQTFLRGRHGTACSIPFELKASKYLRACGWCFSWMKSWSADGAKKSC